MKKAIDCKEVEVVEVGFERTVVREFNSGDMVTVPSGDKAEVLFFAKPEQKYAVLLDSNTTGEVELFEASELTKYVEDGYIDALMRSISMFGALVSNDYNGTPHCKSRLGELVDELLAEGYESTEELNVGAIVVTNKKGQHHNVGKVYEVTFDGSYIVTFGGIYIAQCYDREELILI